MDFTKPFVTGSFIAWPGDVMSTTLSLALWLVDGFSKAAPVGGIRVKLKEIDRRAFQNLYGYYLFTNLPSGIYTIVIESDFYFDEESGIDISTLDPKSPVQEIILQPKPVYPFPANATIVRGVVKTGAALVSDAGVKVPSKSIETKTDENGEFALWFKGVKQASLGAEIKKGGDTKTITISVVEGKTTSSGLITFP
ncbi:MAG: hypothetical protein HGA78_00085 [Nitrospirales bacterium]|nr:hypothetical protein [Nitrospirales bacterium]